MLVEVTTPKYLCYYNARKMNGIFQVKTRSGVLINQGLGREETYLERPRFETTFKLNLIYDI